MAPPAPSAVTRFIWLFTLAAVAVVATLSVVIYRTAVNETVAQHSSQQLAMVRTAAVAVEAEIQIDVVAAAAVQQPAERAEHRSGAQPARARRLRCAAELAHQPDRPRRRQGPLVPLDAEREQTRATGSRSYLDKALWQWASNRVNMNQIRVVHGWANSVPSRRALVVPVWRTSPSAEDPKPSNDFNGVLALVIDLNRFVEVYLGPAMNDLAGDQLVVGLATPNLRGADAARQRPAWRRRRRRAQPCRAAGHVDSRRRGWPPPARVGEVERRQ